MCLTWRHDYGLSCREGAAISGMTEEEKRSLRSRMEWLFDNDIAPYMEFRTMAESPEADSLSLDSERLKAERARVLKVGPSSNPTLYDRRLGCPEDSLGAWNDWIFNRWFGIR